MLCGTIEELVNASTAVGIPTWCNDEVGFFQFEPTHRAVLHWNVLPWNVGLKGRFVEVHSLAKAHVEVAGGKRRPESEVK